MREVARCLVLTGVLLLASCDPPAPPPGQRMDQLEPGTSLPLPSAAAGGGQADGEPRSLLPRFDAQIASIAMRTWIYAEPDDRTTRLGYLRAGAVVARASEPSGHRGCEGGWYQIQPRGFVCVGKGASLDVRHPVVRAAVRGPRRGEALPYVYVVSRKPPPHLYFRLPSEEEQEHTEGKRRALSMARKLSERERELLGPPEPIPELLREGKPLPKPYGAERSLHYSTHRGRAALDSAFGLIATFEHTGRRFGLTTELDLLAVDRTRIARPSDVDGVELEGEQIPALVMHRGVPLYRPDDEGRLRKVGTAPHRSAWALTGKDDGNPNGRRETSTGDWLPYGSLLVPELREDPAGFSRKGRKWIEVSISQQLLVAYQGKRPVYATLVSTGRGGMGDPKKTHSTPRGTFMIHAKHITATMSGDEASDESYDLKDVPYVQYFHEGYALHGAYWHDKFGDLRSHGCINLPPKAAAWLFEWTHPAVPDQWHGAQNLQAGTLVYVHR